MDFRPTVCSDVCFAEFQSYQRSINFGEAHDGLGGAWGYGYEAPKGGKGYFEGKGSNVLRQLWQEMDSLPRGAAECLGDKG